MVSAMLEAARMPAARRSRRRDPSLEANLIATETEELRREHRRMQALVRVTKKLFRQRPRKPGAKPPGRPRKAVPLEAVSKPKENPPSAE
jgi:hypothetical protein